MRRIEIAAQRKQRSQAKPREKLRQRFHCKIEINCIRSVPPRCRIRPRAPYPVHARALALSRLVSLSSIECNKICLLFRNKENVRPCSASALFCVFVWLVLLVRVSEFPIVLSGTLCAISLPLFSVDYFFDCLDRSSIMLCLRSNFTWQKMSLLANSDSNTTETIARSYFMNEGGGHKCILRSPKCKFKRIRFEIVYAACAPNTPNKRIHLHTPSVALLARLPSILGGCCCTLSTLLFFFFFLSQTSIIVCLRRCRRRFTRMGNGSRIFHAILLIKYWIYVNASSGW